MAQVTLRINGYAYTLGCQDGEEDHLHAMAAEVDKRIDTVKASAGPSGEARMLVIAALLMADDVYEMRQRLADAGSGNAAGGEAESGKAPAVDTRLGRRLGKLAKRAEDIAAGLEHP
jgi:cell division protein ZapA